MWMDFTLSVSIWHKHTQTYNTVAFVQRVKKLARFHRLINKCGGVILTKLIYWHINSGL